MTRADLIAALEKAEGPSRELDAEIRKHVPGDYLPAFTASLDAALTLVPKGWRWNVSNRASSPHTGRAHVENRELHFIGMGGMAPNPKLRWYECTAATPAIALCIAALKARE